MWLKLYREITKTSSKARAARKTLVQVHPSGWYFFWYYFFGALLLIGIVGIIIIAVGLIKQYSTQYIVTSRRIIVQTGWLSKHQTEVWIKDIRGATLKASIWERLIGTGSIALGTAATSGTEIKMVGIKKPQTIINIIHNMRSEE